ncbi:hypothetical protein BC831DRAFT_509256 [Entophlyctis helioformis]|nr:hypothetical protein BC831DRAFT_509256 [Entophlyctis helioformis]
MTTKTQTLASFRALLRAQRKTFQGDALQIANAARYTRQEFLKNKDVESPEEISKLVRIAKDAATLITRNVVQGVRKPATNDTYVLKITRDTEVNSNDTIKLAGKGAVNKAAGGCCQQNAPTQAR